VGSDGKYRNLLEKPLCCLRKTGFNDLGFECPPR
jgi:hypothetical protein